MATIIAAMLVLFGLLILTLCILGLSIIVLHFYELLIDTWDDLTGKLRERKWNKYD